MAEADDARWCMGCRARQESNQSTGTDETEIGSFGPVLFKGNCRPTHLFDGDDGACERFAADARRIAVGWPIRHNRARWAF